MPTDVVLQKPRQRGDNIVVTGAINGKEYTVRVWKSHLDTLSTAALKRRYLAEQIKALYDAEQEVEIALEGTVTLP